MVWNQRYAEIYRLPQDLLAARPHVNGVMTELVARGILKGDTDRRAIDQKIAAMDQYSIDSQRVEEFSDGRLILVSRQPMAGGGWVSTHEDITERVRREEELRKQAAELARINKRFDAALSTMTQGMCMFDDQKRLIVWTDRYAELYQVPPDLLKVGTPLEAIHTDRLARGVVKGDTSALAVKTRVAELARLPTDSSRIDELADGRFVLLSRQPMEGGGWLSIIEDITERRRAEAEIVHLLRGMTF